MKIGVFCSIIFFEINALFLAVFSLTNSIHPWRNLPSVLQIYTLLSAKTELTSSTECFPRRNHLRNYSRKEMIFLRNLVSVDICQCEELQNNMGNTWFLVLYARVLISDFSTSRLLYHLPIAGNKQKKTLKVINKHTYCYLLLLQYVFLLLITNWRNSHFSLFCGNN